MGLYAGRKGVGVKSQLTTSLEITNPCKAEGVNNKPERETDERE